MKRARKVQKERKGGTEGCPFSVCRFPFSWLQLAPMRFGRQSTGERSAPSKTMVWIRHCTDQFKNYVAQCEKNVLDTGYSPLCSRPNYARFSHLIGRSTPRIWPMKVGATTFDNVYQICSYHCSKLVHMTQNKLL